MKFQLEERFDTLPKYVQAGLGKAGDDLQKIGKEVINKAYKNGTNGGLKLGNFAGGQVHDIILKAGHAIGYKFKPWQAVRWAKNAAIGGAVLNVLGVGLGVYMQLKNDQDEENEREQLKHDRQNIRSQFNNTADEFEVYGRKYIQACIEEPLEEPIREIDQVLRDIRDNKKHQSLALREMESIQRECQELIRQIHQAYSI